MSYRRKTCECCRERLQGHEVYWCSECRAGVTGAYHATKEVLAEGPAPGQTELEHALEVLERAFRRNFEARSAEGKTQ